MANRIASRVDAAELRQEPNCGSAKQNLFATGKLNKGSLTITNTRISQLIGSDWFLVNVVHIWLIARWRCSQ